MECDLFYFKMKLLIIHGTMDFIIPKDESKVIYDALPEKVE